jgi:hypothetical protein
VFDTIRLVWVVAVFIAICVAFANKENLM